MWIQIRRAYPESQLQRLGFVDFERLICKMNYVIVGECLFLSSQPLRELNASSERALLVPDHPTKERTLVRRSWMKINFAPGSGFISLGSIAEFFSEKG